MLKLLAIFVGGGLGSMCRYAFSHFNVNTFATIPYGTLAANFTSSFMLGALVAWFAGKSVNPPLMALLATGFCGGFSTFSTFSLELFQLSKNGFNTLAFIYMACSILVGLLAIWLGFKLFS